VCVLAGATGMSITMFAICNVVGTLVAVSFYYRLAESIKGPLDAINRFYSHNFKWLLALSVLFTLYWLWDQRRKGKTMSLSEAEAVLEGTGTAEGADGSAAGASGAEEPAT
jgi:membrane protein DedA with SNARE-associated domain